MKTKIVYKKAKIHPILKLLGYLSIGFMGFVYAGMIIGSWFGLGTTNEDVILIFKVLGAVAVSTNVICWKLADSLLSGDLE